MNTKATLGQLMDQGFQNAFNRLISKELEVGASFKMSKVIEEVRSNQNRFESERMKIVNKLAEKDESGANKILEERDEEGRLISSTFEFSEENLEKFRKKFESLKKVKVDIPAIELEILKGIRVSPVDIEAMSFLIVSE